MITRRDIIVATFSMLATAALGTFAQSGGKPLMHSTVFKWGDLKTAATKTGERRDIFDSPTTTLDRFECHVTTVNPGEAPHAAHRHPEEELLIIKDGTFEIIQNDRTNRVEAGSVVFEGSNELHGARNVGTNRATYYVLKWFPPGSSRVR